MNYCIRKKTFGSATVETAQKIAEFYYNFKTPLNSYIFVLFQIYSPIARSCTSNRLFYYNICIHHFGFYFSTHALWHIIFQYVLFIFHRFRFFISFISKYWNASTSVLPNISFLMHPLEDKLVSRYINITKVLLSCSHGRR
jgi:hypothetical protein